MYQDVALFTETISSALGEGVLLQTSSIRSQLEALDGHSAVTECACQYDEALLRSFELFLDYLHFRPFVPFLAITYVLSLFVPLPSGGD